MKRNFKLFLGLLTGILAGLCLFPEYAAAEQPILVYLNGKSIQADVKPCLVNGRVYLPVRAFCEALGAQVTWDEKNSVVNIELDNDLTQAGENQNSGLLQGEKAPNILVCLNGKSMNNIEPYVVNGRVYLPVRAFCETLGALVTWDAKSGNVYIESDNSVTPEAGRDTNSISTPIKKAPNLVEAYAMIIDDLYTIYPDLNYNIKYLDIDTSIIVNLTDQEKTKLLKLVDDKYDLIILNKTRQELEKEGYIKNSDNVNYQYPEFPEGIKFTIFDHPVNNNSIKMTAFKFRREFDLVGRVDFKMEYKNGSWIIESKAVEGPKISSSKKAPNLYEIYAMIIDEFYRLNSQLITKYIAIDTSGMNNLTDQEKTKLLELIQDKYGLTILNKTQEELKKEGYIKYIDNKFGGLFEEFQSGILISIVDKPIENNSIIANARQCRRVTEPIWYAHIVIEYNEGNWVITSYGPLDSTGCYARDWVY